MALCGAKTRSGEPCKRHTVPGAPGSIGPVRGIRTLACVELVNTLGECRLLNCV